MKNLGLLSLATVLVLGAARSLGAQRTSGVPLFTRMKTVDGADSGKIAITGTIDRDFVEDVTGFLRLELTARRTLVDTLLKRLQAEKVDTASISRFLTSRGVSPELVSALMSSFVAHITSCAAGFIRTH